MLWQLQMKVGCYERQQIRRRRTRAQRIDMSQVYTHISPRVGFHELENQGYDSRRNRVSRRGIIFNVR